MNPATKQLLQSNLLFCGLVPLIIGVLGAFLLVLGLGGSPSSGAEFWLVGLLMASLFTLLVFIPLFLLSLSLQFALIYLRRGQQENNQWIFRTGMLLFVIFLVITIPFLFFNLVGLPVLAIAGLWSLRRVNHWFLTSEAFPAETEKAKRGLDETEAPEKAKRSGGWQPSRFLIYTLVLLLFACAAYTYFVLPAGNSVPLTDDVFALHTQGNAAFDAGDYEAAIDNFDRAIELAPYNADLYLNRAAAYHRLGDYENALADYQAAITLNPAIAGIYYNRADIYYQQANYELAIADYTRAIELEPSYTRAYYNRGGIYFLQGNYELALPDFNRAIELDPNYVFAYNDRGLIYYSLGNFQAALDDFNTIMRIDPDYANAYVGRGSTYYMMGNTEAALADWAQGEALGAELPPDVEAVRQELSGSSD